MFWRSSRPTDLGPSSSAAVSRAVTFVGFSEAQPYLYEFIWSGDGRRVSLHDAACTLIQFSPIERGLRLSFRLDGLGESESAGPGQHLALTFEDARAIAWEQDESTARGEHIPWRGQVSDLSRTGQVFVLTLLDLEFVFEAATVTADIR